jgi:hypothetical protein
MKRLEVTLGNVERYEWIEVPKKKKTFKKAALWYANKLIKNLELIKGDIIIVRNHKGREKKYHVHSLDYFLTRKLKWKSSKKNSNKDQYPQSIK